MATGREPPRPFIELWGWAEFLEASGRTDAGLRYMAGAYKDFPRPLAELRQGPVFWATECRDFLAVHKKAPRGRPIEDELLRRMYAMAEAGVPPLVIARETGISKATVYRRLAERRRE